MYCPNCGAQCADTHRFCYQCGNALPEQNEQPILPAEEISVPVSAEPVAAMEAEPAAADTPETDTAVSSEVPPENDPGAELPEQISDPAAQQPEVYTPASSEPEPIPAAPAPRKGRLWPPIAALAVMICVGMLVFFMSGGGEPAAPVSETPWFTIENGVLSFDPALYTGPAELTIPETVDGQTVTAIADNAFNGCDTLTTVIIPDTVTSIGDYAFGSCHALRGIYIPSTVRTVGMYAFADCTAMEAIYISATLESLGHGALDACTSLRYIVFSGSYSQWIALYQGIYSSNVELHASDGIYYAQP